MVNVVWVLVPLTFTLIKFIVGLVVVILCNLRVGIIQKNTGPISHHIRGGSINLELLVMLEVVLVLGTSASPPIKLILVETGMMSGFVHLRVIVQYYIWCNLGLGII